jgi:histidinol dehydrogenase
MPTRLDARDKDFERALTTLLEAKRADEADVSRAVQDIIIQVRAKGDQALIELARRFDGAELTAQTLRVSADEIAAAERSVPELAKEALCFAAARIEAYHRRQLPEDARYTDQAGASLGWRWRALDSVGLYVPGGTASYPSSLLMNAVPAKVAGVGRIAMVTPATGGAIPPLTLAAASIVGVSEIYRAGGAQAVAALAYGTETIFAVDKIVGPGNAYVATAKREVFGRVGIDSIAGPSEILVIADGANDPAWIAADLLSQAEHDVSSQSVLVTDDAEFAERVAEAVDRQLAALPRAAIARASWRDHGAIVVVETIEDAAAIADRFAPEHLEIATEEPEAIFARVRHAGACFLGRYAPETIGDYVAGPNHVLPTSGTARFASGLSVLDFMKRTTILSCDVDALNRLGPAALTLAKAEGLDAHARSVAIRLNRP